jgi:hypothetical protein
MHDVPRGDLTRALGGVALRDGRITLNSSEAVPRRVDLAMAEAGEIKLVAFPDPESGVSGSRARRF